MKLLPDMLQSVAMKYGKRIAFDSLDRQITFNQLFERTRYLAGALANLGVKKGDRVSILAENCTDYITYHFALGMLAAILLPLNIRHTTQEMAWMIDNAESSVLVVDESLSAHLPELTARCTSVRFSIAIGSANGTHYTTGDLVAGKLEGPDPPLSISPQDPVLLIYTSGTTGKPKGALQTHEGICITDSLTAEEWQVTEQDVYLAFMPYFHQAGLTRTRAMMAGGGKNIVAGKMDLDRMISCLIEQNVSIAVLPHPYNTGLAETARKRGITLPHLRLIIGLAGGGPIIAERTRDFCEKFDCEFRGVYGQTETSGPVTYVMGEDFFNNPYTCGQPRRGMEVAIWDENNYPVPAGHIGEIMVRSKTTIPGYWRNEQASKELYSDGWLHTGDLGKLDQNGFLYMMGRKKELVKTGGENVYPGEVEDVLRKHPAIEDVAIIGLPDPEGWGELVVAIIVLKAGENLSLEEVKDFCRGRIAGYKIPKAIKIVEELPKNLTGKVMRMELQKRFADSDLAAAEKDDRHGS